MPSGLYPEVMMDLRMPIFFHPLYTDGIHPDARFPRDRYARLARRLSGGLAATMVRIEEAPQGDRSDILRAHEAAYVSRFLDGSMEDKEKRRIGLRPWTPQLIPRTLHIVGGALAALQSVAQSGGFAANMAGGTHHAHRDFGSGYCVFNDLAICTKYALQELGFQRVMILDLDVHQGDGTATILAKEPAALTVSVHCGVNFPFRKCKSDHDFVLEREAGDSEYLDAVAAAIQVGLNFNPDLVLYQAGVDGLESDALGRLRVSRRGMQQRNRMVFEMCQSYGWPCVVFMGGGYSKPIEPTLDAFEDLFLDAARWHTRCLSPVDAARGRDA